MFSNNKDLSEEEIQFQENLDRDWKNDRNNIFKRRKLSLCKTSVTNRLIELTPDHFQLSIRGKEPWKPRGMNLDALVIRLLTRTNHFFGGCYYQFSKLGYLEIIGQFDLQTVICEPHVHWRLTTQDGFQDYFAQVKTVTTPHQIWNAFNGRGNPDHLITQEFHSEFFKPTSPWFHNRCEIFDKAELIK